MSGFHPEAYAYLARILRRHPRESVLQPNVPIILAALDIAAADPAPSPRLSKAAPALLAACREALTLHEDDEGIAGVLYAAIASAEGEPEADGDRTVHPTLNNAPFAPNGLALLQNRVTELEKLVNEIAKLAMHEALHGRQRDDLGFALHSWLKTRAEWV